MVIIRLLIKPLVLIVSLFVKPCIVFESIPVFSDNTKCVCNELERRGYRKKYNFIWRTGFETIGDNRQKNEWKIYSPKSIKQFFISASFVKKRKCTIYGNAIYGFKDNEETVFFLNHGGPFKATKGYYSMPEYVDYVLSLSEYLAPIAAEQGDVPVEKMFSLGFPRNDCLTKPAKNIKHALKTECKKIIVWYPTYRQNKNSNMHLNEKSLPIVSDESIVKKINDYAKQRNILIVIKPHFVQDLSYFKFSELSNIRRIDDSFFSENNLTSYEFVGACDALLTDYSSIYYDYTLCDKPIGVIWTDINEYKASPGFAVDLDVVLKGAEKLYNIDDFKRFLDEIAFGEDSLAEERRDVRDNIVQFVDGKSTQRVTDFIIEKANL